MFDDVPPLTDAQVAALAKPGESWEDARDRAERLHRCVVKCWPCPTCNATGVMRFGGWIDDEAYGCGTCALRACYLPKLPHSF
jgi:hypothetical protein